MQRLLTLAAVLLLTLPAAAEASTSAGGRADFTIASRTAKVLKRGKVKMSAIGGSASKKKAMLPVAKSSSTTISLSGSLKFKRGKSSVKLTKLVLDRSQGLIYAKVGKVNTPFFLADVSKATQVQDGTDAKYGPIRVKLSAIGASVFAARTGAKIGTGSSFATLRVTLQGASTRLSLDPAFSGTLSSAGIQVGPSSPAVEGSSSLHVPVSTSGGKVSLSKPITHTGGIELTSSAAQLTLSNLTIDAAAGLVYAEQATGPLPVFTIDASAAKSTKRSKQLLITGLKLSLTADAATLLNTTFATTVFAAGAPAASAIVLGLR